MSLLVGQVFWLSMAVALTGILHMFVVKANFLSALAIPIDGGRSLGGRPVFGPNKTWRGLFFMIAGASFMGAVQGLVGGPWAAQCGVEVIDFAAWGTRWGAPDGILSYVFGYAGVNAVLGLGYALGELPNSFIKRRLGIEAGKMSGGVIGGLFFVIDQADSVVAALVLGALVFGFSWPVVLAGSICLTGLHLAINGSLFVMRVRKDL